MWFVNMIGRFIYWLVESGDEPPAMTSIMYREYRIQPYDWMEDEFLYSHADYGGPTDNRCGTAGTVDDCKARIDALEESEVSDE